MAIIHQEMKERLNFTGSQEQLRCIMRETGFTWKRCASNRKLLMEREDVVQCRIRYLKALRKERQAGRRIVYMDETYVNSGHTANKCWQMDNIGMHVPFSKGEILIIVHAG